MVVGSDLMSELQRAAVLAVKMVHLMVGKWVVRWAKKWAMKQAVVKAAKSAAQMVDPKDGQKVESTAA